MMEFEYSPRHSASSAPHLLSPTHAHGSTVDKFASIRQIRRSLSRSPSKPQRFTLTTSPPTPRAPSSLSRAFTTDAAGELNPKPKYAVKRTSSLRASSRRTSPNSPLRRALSDQTNQANAPPRPSRPTSAEDAREDQENMDCADAAQAAAPPETRPDEPIKIDFLKRDKLLQPVLREHGSPMKSSPLKRSDGVLNLEAASVGSPRNKRRSLHGASSFGNDFNVFDHAHEGIAHADSAESGRSSDEKERDPGAPTPHSPPRRSFSLRKSTLQQRAGPGRSKPASSEAPRDGGLNPALTRARSRMSLDSALPFRSLDFDSPFRGANINDPPVVFQPPAQRPYQSAPKPHPLSHALTPSSSSSSPRVDDDKSYHAQRPGALGTSRLDFAKPPLRGFSKSLPVGAVRPGEDIDDDASPTSSQESFATPAGYKMAKPLPQPFHSTGLISKRNRHVDFGASTNSAHMPDTPSKKAAHIHISTPAPSTALGKAVRPLHEFGNPSTPFNARTSQVSPESCGKGVNIFGSLVGAPQLTRRSSFLSIDGDDITNSPTHQHLDSQSSNDELPPTPTKSVSLAAAPKPQSRGKSSSLRSSLFGRRASLGPETFAAPAAEEQSPTSDEFAQSLSPDHDGSDKPSPHTPQEPFMPPDPSSLSISADLRPTTSFGGRSASGFQVPATPTGPRSDHTFVSTFGPGHASSGYFANDVDPALTSRFGHITTSGIGEFSQVYRVEKPLPGTKTGSQTLLSPRAQVWAVKKSRKPYTGHKDRARKLREAQILDALRGHEHVIGLLDYWEAKNHLYIQTEFCERGNLKDFLLQTGFKGRLDDFRIWKILLELAQGVQSIHDANYMHLDLKPANIFIDGDGSLKIGDFGLASAWPAPPGLDGEGDREYIGPEVLCGRFDKPADIFALGMIMLETAGNIVLPDNGASWQRLRAGDLSDLPSLTATSDTPLVRDASGDPVEAADDGAACSSPAEDEFDFLRTAVTDEHRPQRRDLQTPPPFMVDPTHADALEHVVQWMICPDPDRRPTVDQLLRAGGVEWVARRRQAGATTYEGSWGPADAADVAHDVEMTDW